MNSNETQFSENPGVHKYGYRAKFLIKLNDSAESGIPSVCVAVIWETKSLRCQGKEEETT